MKAKLTQVGSAAALAALLAMPALAQTTTPSTTSPSGAMRTDAAMPASKDEVRASKLIGSTVYNEQNQSVGTLDDILMTHDQKQPVQAVISVGGFLGIGSKLVEVPYDRLTLQENNKVVMPNASRDDLKSMPSFSYNTLDHSGTTNASSSSGTGSTAAGSSSSATMGTTSGAGTTAPASDRNR